MAGLRAGLESGELHFRKDHSYCLSEKDLERWRTNTGMKRKKGEGTLLGGYTGGSIPASPERDQPMKARTNTRQAGAVVAGRDGETRLNG